MSLDHSVWIRVRGFELSAAAMVQPDSGSEHATMGLRIVGSGAVLVPNL